MSENTPAGSDAESAAGDQIIPPRPPLPAPTPVEPAAAQPTVEQPSAPYAAQAPYVAPSAPTPPVPPVSSTPSAQGAPNAPTAPLYGQPASAATPGSAGSAYGQPTAAYGTFGAAPAGPVTGSVAAPAASSSAAKVGAGKIVGIMVAAALVGGAAGLGSAAAGASFFAQPQTVVTSGSSTVTVNNTDSVNQTTAIAAKVVPSVVTISATSGSSGGTGSGVILSADGYVATNTHVVTLDGETGNATITVTDSNGKVYQATVVGTDPTYDLAVIKLEGASDLTPIEFGDSSKLNVGDQTVAVGAPLGLSNTVTTGIVSALNRSIQIASSAAPEGEDEDQDSQDQSDESPFQFDFGQGEQQSTTTSTISIAVIQTDAAINPGNSGGALVNGDGDLIGINVAIATASSSSSSSSGSIGVGFSIPSNIVERVTGELIKNGEATHGLLGAMVQDAASQEGATLAGAYISSVSSGGAAEKAGLKAGDVVTSFNDFPVTDATDLTAQVRALAAGSTATIVYVRDGETKSAEVTLGELTAQ
ncbi:S1C family serine protease [Microbacterium sp.]|uniref:S1C family serine protease n=1 Tax=Microbacterium sp. TaxID=51671 RepID=UPI0039E6E743